VFAGLAPSTLWFAVHVAAFLVASLACVASLPALAKIRNADTQRGLRWLLGLSGGWAAAHVGFLVAPGRVPKLVFYSAGLVVGFAAVGAWLYVCSAYTGRSYHRNPTYRRAAAGVFLGVIALKLTNPLHDAYYTVAVAAEPFPHLAVQSGVLHWVAMATAYALAFVGYFMLFELFVEIDHDTRPLLVLVALTGTPALLDLVGTTTTLLVDITYEPLGVAVFAIGVTVGYIDRFEAIRLAAERDTPVVAVGSGGRIREVNHAAERLFPVLADARGQPFDAALPAVAARLDDGDPILPVAGAGGSTRYYRITQTPYGAGQTGLGRTVVFSDVTDRERYRRELERQNDRLERFAQLLSHDLRNPLNVATGRIDLVRDEIGDDEHVEAVQEALDRMAALIDDILTLARTGETVENWESVDLATVARDSWEMVETADAELDGTITRSVRADPDRVKRLFENLFRNAIDHAGPETTLTIGDLPDERGFFVQDDGPGIPESDRDVVFDHGYTTDDAGTGFGLSIVGEVVEAHGWSITITESPDGGARFEIAGVEPAT
jgi:signal transduction histidine kinase